MNRPRALDLFCGGGGVSEGLRRAGFEVVGVDIVDHSRVYCRGPGRLCLENPATFVQADALAFLREVIAGRNGCFDLICASPPCQAHSTLRHLQAGKVYPDLIEPTRELLRAWGGLWCIENVPGAPLGGAHLTMLCGSMFGLQTPDGRAELRRHRLFETSFSIPLRPACQHGHESMESLSVCGTGMGPGNRGKEAEMRAKREMISINGDHPNSPGARHLRPAQVAARRRALSVTGHAVEVSPSNWPETGQKGLPGVSNARKVLTVSGDRPNSANTPRKVITVTGRTAVENRKIVCVGGGKAMSGGMSKLQGLLASRPAAQRETFSTADARAAMGIDWMGMKCLSQAIPPVYAEWIGRQALAYLPNTDAPR